MNATARLILNIPKFGHHLGWNSCEPSLVAGPTTNQLQGLLPCSQLSGWCSFGISVWGMSIHQFNIRSSTPSFCTPKRPSGASSQDSELWCQRICCFWTVVELIAYVCLFVNYMTNRNNYFKRHSKHFLCRSSERFCGFISEVALYQIFITITNNMVTDHK